MDSTVLDNAVKVLKAATQDAVSSYHGHSEKVKTVAWSPDGTRIALASSREIQVWSVGTGTTLLTYRSHSDKVRVVAWSPDGTRIALVGFEEKTVQVWDASEQGYSSHLSWPC